MRRARRRPRPPDASTGSRDARPPDRRACARSSAIVAEVRARDRGRVGRPVGAGRHLAVPVRVRPDGAAAVPPAASYDSYGATPGRLSRSRLRRSTGMTRLSRRADADTPYPIARAPRAARQAEGRGAPRPAPRRRSSASTTAASSPPASASTSCSTRARSSSSTCSPATAPTASASRTTGRSPTASSPAGARSTAARSSCSRQDFTDLRRRARRGLRREDPQGDGPRRVGRARRSSASTTAAARASRKVSCRSRRYGGIFFRNVKASGVIPQISVVLGPCAGGAVYSPAMTDFIFMVKGVSNMFITGPDVVKTVTGEEVTHEELGGAIDARDEVGRRDVRRRRRADVHRAGALPVVVPARRTTSRTRRTSSRPTIAERSCDALHRPRFPTRRTAPYDMKKVIAEIVDDGDFFEVFPLWAMNIVCGFARLDGHVVGIVGNQPQVLAGCLDIDASEKAARFVRTCDAFNIPLRHVRRRARVPARHRPGVRRHHPPRRQAALRVLRGDACRACRSSRARVTAARTSS